MANEGLTSELNQQKQGPSLVEDQIQGPSLVKDPKQYYLHHWDLYWQSPKENSEGCQNQEACESLTIVQGIASEGITSSVSEL